LQEVQIKSLLYALLSTAQVENDNKYLDIATSIANQTSLQDYLEGLIDETDIDYTPSSDSTASTDAVPTPPVADSTAVSSDASTDSTQPQPIPTDSTDSTDSTPQPIPLPDAVSA
jgi:hypothetical protein